MSFSSFRHSQTVSINRLKPAWCIDVNDTTTPDSLLALPKEPPSHLSLQDACDNVNNSATDDTLCNVSPSVHSEICADSAFINTTPLTTMALVSTETLQDITGITTFHINVSAFISDELSMQLRHNTLLTLLCPEPNNIHLVKHFSLPPNCNPDLIWAFLNTDGILSISIPLLDVPLHSSTSTPIAVSSDGFKIKAHTLSHLALCRGFIHTCSCNSHSHTH